MLLSEGLTFLYVFELDTHLKKHSLPYKKKKLKNEKIVLIISHLQEARGKTLATMIVPGQHLLQANEPTSDDNDKKGGHDTVVVGEIWCSETEGMLSESENDDSECELLPSLVKKNCST